MLDVALAFLWPDGMMNHTCIEPDEVLPPVHRSFKLTPTADGHVSLVTLTSAQWKNLVDALADPDEAGDLSDTAARMSGGAAIMRAVRAKVSTMTTADVVRRLADADVPCAPVLQLDELWQHEQIAAVGAIREFDHVVLGPIRQPRPAPRFDGEDQPTAAWAPTLGQHTDDILEAAGLSSTEIKELRADGVIG